ncbi:MAG: hypothetical protein COT18_12965 [Elusimicrobia bacterium CG08_land_8_20_14_0_20_59_10]|nr:MAG: hypothetical protein COT18_12965 [Elusimicrobia bacterium CG08_land_8_20_14_0_20_59_10]
MHFFRLRVINTVLFLLVGVLLGFILKDRLQAPSVSTAIPRYQPAYDQPAGARGAPEEFAPDADAAPETYEDPVLPREPSGSAAEDEEPAGELMIEPDTQEAPVSPVRPSVLKLEAGLFFKNPTAYAGRKLEMTLQLITARKGTRGWRLNFVCAAPDKTIDYLFVDSGDALGDSPDLRIGYVYRVVFECGRGYAAEGNLLSSIEHTGQKADWATGLSATD